MKFNISLPSWATRGPRIKETATLANLGQPTKKAKSMVAEIVPKSISQVRKDIKDYSESLDMMQVADEPKFWPYYNLVREILRDLHLKSQVNNRILKSLSRPFVIKNAKGDVDEDLTNQLQNQTWVYQLNKHIVETVFFGHSLVELGFEIDKNTKALKLTVKLVPRQNVDSIHGWLYLDYADDKKIKYREQREYGNWLMEFGDIIDNDFGLLNGCVPHVLMKRFAQSCWSELAEIYGIPPRVMKTNTQDRLMVNRAEKMMSDMGAAAWFIIDENESFEFAKGVSTNGDVYKELVKLCNNEMSMGISGVVIGQDTVNGSNSKEQTSLEIKNDLVDSDLTLIEQYWNTTVIPGLQQIGIIPSGELVFGYEPTEDVDKLWNMVVQALPHYEIDPEWVKTKFGIEITGIKKAETPGNQNLTLNLPDSFFL